VLLPLWARRMSVLDQLRRGMLSMVQFSKLQVEILESRDFTHGDLQRPRKGYRRGSERRNC